MKVTKGSKITKKAAPYYVELSNSYATLAKFLGDLGPAHKEIEGVSSSRQAAASTFKAKAERRRKSRTATYIAAMNDEGIIDLHINLAEDEWTVMAKNRAERAAL